MSGIKYILMVKLITTHLLMKESNITQEVMVFEQTTLLSLVEA